VAPQQNCSRYYAYVPNAICAAGLDGAHLCNGDSGGPLQWVRLKKLSVCSKMPLGNVLFNSHKRKVYGIGPLGTIIEVSRKEITYSEINYLGKFVFKKLPLTNTYASYWYRYYIFICRARDIGRLKIQTSVN